MSRLDPRWLLLRVKLRGEMKAAPTRAAAAPLPRDARPPAIPKERTAP
jgi:hypothetical protein